MSIKLDRGLFNPAQGTGITAGVSTSVPLSYNPDCTITIGTLSFGDPVQTDIPGTANAECKITVDSGLVDRSLIDLEPTAKQVYGLLPAQIKTVLLLSEGWLVGSSVEKLLNGQDVKDYDVLVPSRELFQLTTAHLDNLNFIDFSLNTFGGLKVDLGTLSLDIWPEELGHFLQNCSAFNYVYSLKKQILFKNNG